MVQRFSTPPSHGGNTGSNPLSATKNKGTPLSEDSDLPRWPQGDQKFPSHAELVVRGWIRGDPTTKFCKTCGRLCEWWGKPDGSEWKLFNPRTTQFHSETCRR